MPESSLPVEYLFTITADTANNTMLTGAPQGSRLIVAVTGGTFEGPKLKGTIDVPGGDWLTMRPDGSAKLDVRLSLKTEDGAVILMTYNGVGVTKDGAFSIRTAPLFETGDERYAWLNNVQGIGIGAPGPGNVTYQIYALQ